MKIITILGSPRKKGNTAKVLSMFEDNVEKNHQVERINITQYKVGGCLGCLKCQEKRGEPGCVQKDDALMIFEKMIRADAIVYASPLYCWSFTSQIKPLIDRHFCLVTGAGTPEHDSLISGKPAALLVTCAGPIGGNCDAIQGIFTGFSDYTKLMAKGHFILPFCTTPDAIGDKGSELAGDLVRAITG
ncbi:MAG: flavodoxin family protein [Desulfobacteraceae bacterium]|jgi:multimeric flavodoxin WrbA|nr:flavodoxin family protein [Desulfobacteraceae bacterium]MDH3575374.1 flavodoxin family protein [Desulfobacteraceae bacterium]MDH3838409.1 flavodoxin family protein [Desulfobacteraceae bacterium]MDH3875642.1 flavodoxin family protein [Desulfobacteraceae bacterium]